MSDDPKRRKQHFKSFVKGGKGLGLAKRLRLLFTEAGYMAMPIDEFTSAIRAGRYPAGTLAFAVVDERDRKPRFLGTVVIVGGDGGLAYEGETTELRSIVEGM
jgi:hypothetical protein